MSLHGNVSLFTSLDLSIDRFTLELTAWFASYKHKGCNQMSVFDNLCETGLRNLRVERKSDDNVSAVICLKYTFITNVADKDIYEFWQRLWWTNNVTETLLLNNLKLVLWNGNATSSNSTNYILWLLVGSVYTVTFSTCCHLCSDTMFDLPSKPRFTVFLSRQTFKFVQVQ